MIRGFLLALALLIAAAPARAEDMTFFIMNRAPYGVVIEFSDAASGKVWPGRDRIYLLEKGESKSVAIGCTGGVLICYGAWRNGDDRTVWGVGPDRDLECDDCCRICALGPGKGETIEIEP